MTNSSGSILEPVERIPEALFAFDHGSDIYVLVQRCTIQQGARWSRSKFRSEDKVRTCIKQLATAALLASLAAAQTSSSGDDKATRDSSTEPWSYYINFAGYVVPHGTSYVSPSFSADRASLHLGARYNYEDKETGSLWLGYNLETVNKLAFRVTLAVEGVSGKHDGARTWLPERGLLLGLSTAGWSL